ncbi:LytTR family transcriptional regulator [Hyunsoonleella flava]|uniref:LytTR family transcriptional regulator n=2 Tax=Hyunsoonleella flava TaxID=2527939 RepID=A0A4V2JAM5_9FLAO|nr:LytTR family transcriptional regulator [Hyunsoonleella flava]
MLFIIFSLVINHLSSPESFSVGDSYRFPLEGFLSSIILCILIAIIAELNFKYYTKKYFSKKVEIRSVSWYMVSTLGYIAIMYVPLGIVLVMVAGADMEFYYLLIGLLLTLLVSFVLIGLAYAQDIYNLYKRSIKDAQITIESGAKTTKLTYENIACFYSENKVVYTVRNDGSTITTDFTLNELEEKINDQLFFRANRQIIIHKDAVDEIEKIENGKLRIRLKAVIQNNATAEITISRYKRTAFMDWFE